MISSYALSSDVATALSEKAEVSSLSDYYLKSETSSAIEISSALSSKAEVSAVVPAIFRNVHLVKPLLDGHKLHFRADIASDD